MTKSHTYHMKTCRDREEWKQKCGGFHSDFLSCLWMFLFSFYIKTIKSPNLPSIWNSVTVKTVVQQSNKKCTFLRKNQRCVGMSWFLQTIPLQRLKLMLWTELKSHFNDSDSWLGAEGGGGSGGDLDFCVEFLETSCHVSILWLVINCISCA